MFVLKGCNKGRMREREREVEREWEGERERVRGREKGGKRVRDREREWEKRKRDWVVYVLTHLPCNSVRALIPYISELWVRSLVSVSASSPVSLFSFSCLRGQNQTLGCGQWGGGRRGVGSEGEGEGVWAVSGREREAGKGCEIVRKVKVREGG